MSRFRKVLMVLAVTMVGITCLMGISYADNSSQTKLTLNDAINVALKNSKDLIAAEEDVAKALEQRRDIADKVRFIPGGGGNPEGDSLWVSLLKADMQWQILTRGEEETKKQVMLDVTKAFLDLQGKIENLKSAEINKESAESALRIANARLMAGMGLQVEKESAELALKNAQDSMENAKIAVDNAYEVLNRLMGRPLNERYDIEKISYVPMQNINEDVEAEKGVLNSYDIFTAQKQLEAEQWDIDFPYDLGGNFKKFDVEIKDVYKQQAVIESKTASIKEQVRQICHQLQTLQDQYITMVTNKKVSEEKIRLAELQYKVGVGTLDQLKQAEAQFAKDVANLESFTVNYMTLKANLYRLTGRDILAITNE
ncbi:outer membrane efflux protein [Moorella thermoacetica]|uniref:Outer membrane efflux protein n=1 Tax=Neomoorella thermoacetica TaxID=1525 RepID=A0A1J5NNW0_NEOTH|nr:outer membrane efflux protein [Moorella thermoacetica]